jgi:alanine racemase
MWQAEVRIDLGAIAANVARLRAAAPGAELMAVVKADGYGHGMVPVARAATRAGATALGVCTLDEALALRRAGITVPVLAWLVAPGQPLADGIAADVELSAATPGQLDELVAAGVRAGRPARVHLKVDTGLGRGGAARDGWPALVEAAAKAHADGAVEVVGVWSHFARADEPDQPVNGAQLAAFRDALAVAERVGITPRYRHIANSAAALTRPGSHFDMIRTGIAIYGLSPVPGRRFGLRPAMTARARVILAKRVPAGHGVSYGHTYRTERETTLAVLPVGYADGIPRSASNRGPIALAGRVRRIAGRVCMDQVVLDCGDDPVAAGDVAMIFGPGDNGEPTADDWAEAVGTINYEIVTRFGGPRVTRTYLDERATSGGPAGGSAATAGPGPDAGGGAGPAGAGEARGARGVGATGG